MRLARLAPLTLAATLLIPLVACGGSDDGDSMITDPGAWLEAYVGELCPKVHACKADWMSQGGETFADAWGADVAGCKAIFLTADQVRMSVSNGKATFNATAGRDCLAMLNYDSQTCPAFWAASDPAVCATVYTGTVTAGGACANGLECAAGLACAQGTCMSTAVAPRGAVASDLRSVLAN
jgi:hypothetical protein